MELVKNIAGTVSLAPMAGATDSSFRQICLEFGADFVTSEMVSAKALVMGDRKTPLLMRRADGENPFGIQLFGHDPEDFYKAAMMVEKEFAPEFIDINMGCPAPKITGGGAGSALMLTPGIAVDIASAVVDAVKVPVSAKIRAGYSAVTAPELAAELEKAGISFIIVHGRTRERMYRPPVDLEVIKRVKQAVSVPVIGNGDIETGEDALRMLKETGCDAVAVGRAALGDPFIFARIKAYLKNEPLPAQPTLEERLAVLKKQVERMVEYKGEYIAMQEARKHAAWYLKGVRSAAKLRALANGLESLSDLERYIETVIRAQER